MKIEISGSKKKIPFFLIIISFLTLIIATSVSAQNGETPINETPGVTPVFETPAVTPVFETPAVTPVNETPGITPVNETPGITPVNETPGITPVNETPGVTPVNETPGITPVNETPGVTPVNETPGITPVNETPGITPVNETPGITPVNETPGVTPVVEATPIAPLVTQPVLPVANFSSNVTNGTAPLDVQFIDSSLNATGWSWDFENDGIVDSTDPNPMHTYPAEGSYTVNLTANNANGTNSTFAAINVSNVSAPVTPSGQELPVANFSSNVTNGTAPLSVQFNDSSLNADNVTWDFGDGNNSTDRNPMHTYFAEGNYTVNLTASNMNGTNSITAPINVLPGQGPVQPVLPVANFSSNVTNGTAPLSVQFNDSSLNADNVTWDFGDGNNSTDRNPINTYSAVGNFIVNLTARNANGTNSTTAPINVSAPFQPLLPIANFSSNVTNGTAPLSVQFNDSSLNADNVTWDFGDGNNSTDWNPINTYSAAGNYTVNLTASNANGTNSKTAPINVSAPVPAITSNS